MHQRIFNAEIFYIFGRATQEEIEPIFAALVAIEDEFALIRKRTFGGKLPKAERVTCLNAMLEKPQPQAVQNFIKRLLQVGSTETINALDVAIHHVFTTTEHYNSAIGNHKEKIKLQKETVTHG